jgi:hypothetical protein
LFSTLSSLLMICKKFVTNLLLCNLLLNIFIFNFKKQVKKNNCTYCISEVLFTPPRPKFPVVYTHRMCLQCITLKLRWASFCGMHTTSWSILLVWIVLQSVVNCVVMYLYVGHVWIDLLILCTDISTCEIVHKLFELISISSVG